MFDLRPEEMILRRERVRLAVLLSEYADEIAAQVTDTASAVRFVADLISLKAGVPAVERQADGNFPTSLAG